LAEAELTAHFAAVDEMCKKRRGSGTADPCGCGGGAPTAGGARGGSSAPGSYYQGMTGCGAPIVVSTPYGQKPAALPQQNAVRVPPPAALGYAGGGSTIALSPSQYRVLGPGGGVPAGGGGGLAMQAPPITVRISTGAAGGALPPPGGGAPAGAGGGQFPPYNGNLGSYYANLGRGGGGAGGRGGAAPGATRVPGMSAYTASYLANQAGAAVEDQIATTSASKAVANAHAQELLAEMEAARTANAELAGYEGARNTAAFAGRVAATGQRMGLDPERAREFQLSYLAYAGQYEGNKIDVGQSQRLRETIASYAVGKQGYAAEDSARLLGTLISKSKQGASDEEILGQYGQIAKVMQLAPGYTGPLLGQLSEVVGESVGEGGPFSDALDAAIWLRAESQRNPPRHRPTRGRFYAA
jgi:hypothetical protein